MKFIYWLRLGITIDPKKHNSSTAYNPLSNLENLWSIPSRTFTQRRPEQCFVAKMVSNRQVIRWNLSTGPDWVSQIIQNNESVFFFSCVTRQVSRVSRMPTVRPTRPTDRVVCAVKMFVAVDRAFDVNATATTSASHRVFRRSEAQMLADSDITTDADKERMKCGTISQGFSARFSII